MSAEDETTQEEMDALAAEMIQLRRQNYRYSSEIAKQILVKSGTFSDDEVKEMSDDEAFGRARRMTGFESEEAALSYGITCEAAREVPSPSQPDEPCHDMASPKVPEPQDDATNRGEIESMETKAWRLFTETIPNSRFCDVYLGGAAIVAVCVTIVAGGVLVLMKIMGFHEPGERMSDGLLGAAMMPGVFVLPLFFVFPVFFQFAIPGAYFQIFFRLERAGLSRASSRIIALLAQLGVLTILVILERCARES